MLNLPHPTSKRQSSGIGYVLATGAMAALLVTAAPRLGAQADPLERTKAAYAALKSYADTGTVVNEFGPPNGLVRETHRFVTAYRAPRQFLFDFTKADDADRFVIWGDDAAFHTWWKAVGAQENYPQGRGGEAFVFADPNTMGSALLVPALLFSKAGLQGALTTLRDGKVNGMEDIDGHHCQRIVGTARDVYAATGNEVNLRTATVWIDAETQLVRRVRQEPQGGPPGFIERTIITVDPRANPVIDDARFRFTVPKG